MPAPELVSLPPNQLGRLRLLTLGGMAVAGLIAVLASARAARIEPAVDRPAPLATGVPRVEGTNVDLAWTIETEPVDRIGYRNGQRHVFEVVRLGPTAVEVEVGTARAFLAMRTAAAEAGIDLGLVSGFRTPEQQAALFRAWRAGHGNKAAAPGRSNHQSGRALDIALAAPGALAWLDANAATFGFKRTVKTEPWHWEYVESPIARAEMKRVSRHATKHAKTVGHARRPAQRRVNRRVR